MAVASSLRVLALVTDAFGGQGGIAQYNRDFLTALAGCDRVGEVVVLPRIGGNAVNTQPSGVSQLTAQRGRIAYSLSALRIALTSHFDLIFCGHAFMAPLAAAIAKLLRVPLWVQVHGIEAWQELSAVHRRSLEAATLIGSVSRYTRWRLLEWVGIDPARVKVLPPTVDPRYMPGPKPARLLDRYSAWNKKVLMTVSRLASSERYKGHDRVIRALPRVLAEHPDTIYIVVGDGDDRLRLEALASAVGVRERVHFAGFVEAKELPDHYRVADVFVMPSTGEGFGIAFSEAMAFGLPVIGGNGDGSVDPLGDGALGRLIDPEKVDELKAAICASLKTPAPMQTLVDRFNRDEFTRTVQSLLWLTAASFHSRTNISKARQPVAVS
jgi:phosphatidylinositol alpha-1,6-mannosyltransferase